MNESRNLKDDHQIETLLTVPLSEQTGGAVRKEQITIRLDPGMIVDAREIASRKGIGHHTLLRMWVMEGINRAYEEGSLGHPPRSWSPLARGQTGASAEPVQEVRPAPPSGSRWARLGRSRPS